MLGNPSDRALALANQLGTQFAQRAAEHDAQGTFVAENYELLRAQRVFSALVPAELGGGGWTHGEMCAFLRALAGHCSSTALALSMHQHLVAFQVWNHLHGKPGKALLERVAREQLVLVSTGARDWMESNGTVEKVEGGFRVSAKKAFASGSPAGNILATSAPYQDPAAGWQVLHFAVPMNDPKVRLQADWNTLGMRGTGSQTVVLDGVLVPEQAVSLRRPRGEFHPVWGVILGVALPLIMSVYTGIAEAAAHRAAGHARQSGGTDETTAPLLGAMENARTTAALAQESLVALCNNFDFAPGMEIANAALVRKSIVAQAAKRTVELAMEACGGAGFYRDFALERLWRDVQAGHYHPLPEAKQVLLTGRVLMGRNPMTGAAAAQPQAAD